MLLRRIARPMLASWFIYDGLHAARHPEEHAAAARRGADLIGDRVGLDTPLSEAHITGLIRAHGIATVAAGLCLAAGKAPRTAALALGVLTVPLAIVHEPFTPGGNRQERSRAFIHSVGGIGAALLAAADLEGKPGWSWRIHKARQRVTHLNEARQHATQASKALRRKSAHHKVSIRAPKTTQGLTSTP